MKTMNSMRLLRVNLTENKIIGQEIEAERLRLYMGGSGIGAKILYDETAATTHPLGPENVLIFMTGVFTGTVTLCGKDSYETDHLIKTELGKKAVNCNPYNILMISKALCLFTIKLSS